MTYKLKIDENEYWWGGSTGKAVCPFNAASDYVYKTGTGASNQDTPFFLSDKGRYIWSDRPITLEVQNGMLSIDGEHVEISEGNETLKGAFSAAQARHFKCDKRILPDEFFSAPQLNTWMEFIYYPTQDGVLNYARKYIGTGFKPGVFIIDEGWQGRYGDWEFDFARFPDPGEMVRQLHEMGFKVMLWIVPFVCADGPKFVRSIRPLTGTDPEAAKSLYLRKADGEVAIVKWWNGYGAILDMRDDANREYLSSQLRHLMNDYGIDGFKFDGGSLGAYQPENIVNGEAAQTHNPYALNTAWNEFGAAFTFHEYKDTYCRPGKNTIQRLRDKWHRWDADGLKALIPCAINAGLTGYPFICPDMIGGGEWTFNYMPGFKIDEELFIRMAQCSALFPMMQFSWAPWNALSEENLRICRSAAKLHDDLSGVILNEVRKAEQSGEPILRSLEYNDPGNGYSSITDEFMLGNTILSAPVVEKGATSRLVVFPKGKWIDIQGNVYQGNTQEVLNAPLDTLLWFRNIDETGGRDGN